MKFKAYPITVKPILKEQVWGGHGLSSYIRLPKSRHIGEAWFLADQDGNDSVISSGYYRKWTIDSLIKRFPKEMLGKSAVKKYGRRFPLLFKFIDSKERLSIQVHPDDRFARLHEGKTGKTELWYIVESKPGSYMLAGLAGRYTGSAVKRLALSGRLAGKMKKYSTKKGESYFIPAGTMHTLGPGNIVFEIQQNSDITYRLYDWGRKNLEVQRQLDIFKGADSIKVLKDAGRIKVPAPRVKAGIKIRKIKECPYFRVSEVTALKYARYGHNKKAPVVLAVIQGKISIKGTDRPGHMFKKGDVVFLPYEYTGFIIGLERKTKMIVTEIR